MTPRVDLIIPTRNSPHLLERCLGSVRLISQPEFKLIVVDDASTRPVRTLVQSYFPDAVILRNDRQRGLVHGLNCAIDHGSGEYIALLNDDTEVAADWLSELVDTADRHPGAGSIASKILLMDDRTRFHSAGDTYALTGMPVNRGVWIEDLGQYDQTGEVFSACAGAALYRRSALNDARLDNGDVFDRRLFMYCEDVDLGWRLQRLDYRCYFTPNAVVYHLLSATGGGELASYYVSRNIWLVLANSVPASMFSDKWHRAVAWHLGRFLRELKRIRQPAARAALRGTVVGFVSLFRGWSQRPEIDEHTRLRILNLLEPGRFR